MKKEHIRVVAVDGHRGTQFVWPQETINVFSPTPWPLARHLATQLWERNPLAAEQCIRKPNQIPGLIEFGGRLPTFKFLNNEEYPKVRHLTLGERRNFISELVFHLMDVQKTRGLNTQTKRSKK